MSANKISRYPGPRSFEQYEKEIFYGRTKEAEALYDLVIAQPVVVMFARSGVGKTSLLNAGLLPRVKTLVPLLFRFQDTRTHPLEVLRAGLLPVAYEPKWRAYADSNHPGIWELLKSRELNYFEEMKTPLLIFDQFEELFAHPPDHRDAFTRELYPLIEGKLPDRVEQSLLAVKPEDRSMEFMSWHKPANVKLLFVIRSDKLHLLQEMSKKIGTIFQTRFELLPLKIEQARDAIVNPASLPDRDPPFQTRPFEFPRPILDIITGNLKNTEDEIESAQLQIVCKHVEKQILREQDAGSTALVVREEHLGGKEGIEKILNGFYIDSINRLKEEQKISADEAEAAHHLLQDKLIFNGRRIRLAADMLCNEMNVTQTLLDHLVDTRLIRVEKTPIGNYYEISHDTLVGPILKEKEKRVAKHKRLSTAEDHRIIVNALHENRCVFILGSNLYRFPNGKSLAEGLREHLRTQMPDAPDVIYYSDEELFQFKNARQRTKTYYEIYKFYQNLEPGKAHRLIANLPAPAVLCIGPDGLTQKALAERAIQFDYACFKGVSSFHGHGALLIDLLGNVADSESMILTNHDAFYYVGSLANGQVMPPAAAARVRQADVFVVLGVDFGKWYLRPLFWEILGDSPAVKYTVGKTPTNQYEFETRFKSIFNLDFIDEKEEDFLDALFSALNDYAAGNDSLQETLIRSIPGDLKNNNLEQALEKLMLIADKTVRLEIKDAATALLGQWKEIQNMERSNTLPVDTYYVSRNKLIADAYDLLKRLG